MQASDEALRNTITDALTRANVDARNLTVEVAGGHVVAKGTVPTEQRSAGNAITFSMSPSPGLRTHAGSVLSRN